jgi:hypothetical protein
MNKKVSFYFKMCNFLLHFYSILSQKRMNLYSNQNILILDIYYSGSKVLKHINMYNILEYINLLEGYLRKKFISFLTVCIKR